MKRFDVISLGEALVDFLPLQVGQRVRDVTRWQRCLGGAPANVVVGVSRMGGRSAMAGVTGDDEFGYFISEELAREGVDVSHLRHSKLGKTGIGFVSLTPTGERSFSFYRLRAAEFQLCVDDLDLAFLANTRVLHLGTNSLIEPRARKASLLAARTARQRGQLVSSDPNLRLHLWPDRRILWKLIDTLLPLVSIVKLSDEEIEFVTGEKKPSRALAQLEDRGALLSVVTRGAHGAVLRFNGDEVAVAAPKVKVVDTTGAGDGFMAGMLYGLTRTVSTRRELEAVSVGHLGELASFACLTGARVVTKLGAVAGLPRPAEVEKKVRPSLRRLLWSRG